MKKIYITVLIIFAFNLLKGQQRSIDSLYVRLSVAKSDTQKVNILNKLFWAFNTHNNDSAQNAAQKAYDLSIKINYPEGKINSISNLGTIYYFQGKNAEALKFFLSTIHLIEQLDEKSKNNSYCMRQLSTAYNNIGLIFQQQKQLGQAEEYFRKSIAIDEITGDKKALAHGYNNLGTIKEDLNDYPEALKNFELALKYKNEANDSAGIPSTLINIGIVEMNQGEFEKSSMHFMKALQFSTKINNLQDQALSLINLGDLYYLKKDYAGSIQYYEDGIKICRKQKYIQFVSYAYESISLSYFKLKNFEKAYEFYRYHINVKDSIYNETNTRVLHEMETKFETESKEKEIKLLTTDKELQKVELKNNRIIIYSGLIGLLFLGAFAFYVAYAYRQKQRINQALDLKNKKIEFAYKIIDEKQREVLDSINYAKRIQYALLAHEDFIKKHLVDNFVLFKPKDIVSGDFYWAATAQNKGGDELFYFACCDSTGHGVPGAFMSLLSIGFLSEAIKEKDIFEPNQVFDYVRKRLIDSISKEEQKDGFDGVLMCINKTDNVITYAAANNKPVLVSNGNLKELPCDKMPVGKGDRLDQFNLYAINCKRGDTIYLYSDGYADQFGGTKGKKFKYKQLEDLLQLNVNKTMIEQKDILAETLEKWRGNLDQVDDILVIGVKV